ncbi:MAG: NADH-quinone oxidoreductase subunit H [Syntrophales bacterium]|jgi:formate hydrogenlyase subunit 4|nr:NADH-quinone oxidoreductase subunit H [Syntrophales bacterium]
MNIIFDILQPLFVPLLSPLVIGVIRKIKAKMQNRQGAGVLQPYRDLWKLFHKDEVISQDASWIFRIAPYIIFAVTLIVGAFIPIFNMNTFTAPLGDLLTVVYLLAIGTFFLALAGLDTGSAFGGFAASREMTVSALAEGGLIFSFFILALVSGSTNLFTIADSVLVANITSLQPIILAGLGYFIVLLAESGRYPFDNPATHLELTMIHEAMILEYSGRRLALMEWAAANKLFIFMTLGANLFSPWGLMHEFSLGALAVAVAVFTLKLSAFCFAIAFIESGIAKFRFFRLPDLLIVSFILNIVAIGLIK